MLWPKIFLHMVLVMKLSFLRTGGLCIRPSFGGSVASASAPKVSIIRFTQSSCTAVRGADPEGTAKRRAVLCCSFREVSVPFSREWGWRLSKSYLMHRQIWNWSWEQQCWQSTGIERISEYWCTLSVPILQRLRLLRNYHLALSHLRFLSQPGRIVWWVIRNNMNEPKHSIKVLQSFSIIQMSRNVNVLKKYDALERKTEERQYRNASNFVANIVYQ